MLTLINLKKHIYMNSLLNLHETISFKTKSGKPIKNVTINLLSYIGRLYSTSAHSRNKLISISHQKNLQKNRAKSSSFNVRAQSIKTNYESDGLSECSTHISLLSLESIEMPKRINYGSIGHYSPFERCILYQ